MNSFVPIALFGWVFVVLLLFTVLPPRRAVAAAYIGAWLFLPVAGIGLPGLPDYTKATAASLSVLIAVALFDAGRVWRYRPSWVDLPMLIWCSAPFLSSMSNGLGAYDGLSSVVDQLMTWGVPYFMGRLYFDSPEGLRDLALAVFIGGLIYVPLCLWEVRMSPQLHRMVYGQHPTSFVMTKRFGGYRPMVFMQHGLMLGLWMTSATLVGLWLWRSGGLRRLMGVPASLLSLGLLATTVLCKSVGSLALLAGGLFVLFATRILGGRGALILCAVALAPAYMLVRANGWWDAAPIVDVARHIDEGRADSLEGRLENESLIVHRALSKPAFGWGQWGRWRVRDESGRDVTVSDGLWAITLGQCGLVGLCSMTASLLLPVLLLLKRVPARHWSHQAAAPAAALAMLLVLYSLDMLLNAMLNPLYVLAAGSLSGFFVACRRGAAPPTWAVARPQTAISLSLARPGPSFSPIPTGAIHERHAENP